MSDAPGTPLSAERQERIRTRLGGHEFQKLFATLRRRLEDAGATPVRQVRLSGLGPTERQAIAGLLGQWELTEAEVRIPVARLDEALRSSAVQAGLREVLEVLGGPLEDRHALRESRRASRQSLWAAASAHPVVRQRPELHGWLEELRTQGLLSRAARASGHAEERILQWALEAVARLPADGIQLPVFASEITGDAHALDPGRQLSSLILRAVSHLVRSPVLPSSAAERRQLWAKVGIVCDPLSSHVLTLGLRPLGDERLSRHLRECSAEGEPRRLTLRELSRWAPSLAPGSDVFICENPSVVASAADQLQSCSAALVSVEGQPSTAALMLLTALSRAGARLRFHADFDWSGLRIGNLLSEQLGALPWRFMAEDYLRAVKALPEAVPLTGTPVEARWAPSLAGAMSQSRVAVFEEQLLLDLLSDLALSQ